MVREDKKRMNEICHGDTETQRITKKKDISLLLGDLVASFWMFFSARLIPRHKGSWSLAGKDSYFFFLSEMFREIRKE